MSTGFSVAAVYMTAGLYSPGFEAYNNKTGGQ
jgi:hypothetical protein